MLDLLDIAKRIGPKFPREVFHLDSTDPEWEDDMNYLYPNYAKWTTRFGFHGFAIFLYVYNYQILNYNAHWRALNKLALFFIFFYTTRTIYHYKKDVLRANLFDEYVQLRSDEIIKERQPLLRSDAVKRWTWFNCDLEETLSRCNRQSYTNTSADFKNSELILQDFIRRHTDETAAFPITIENAKIGPENMSLI